jgi:hypothetical protein
VSFGILVACAQAGVDAMGAAIVGGAPPDGDDRTEVEVAPGTFNKGASTFAFVLDEEVEDAVAEGCIALIRQVIGGWIVRGERLEEIGCPALGTVAVDIGEIEQPVPARERRADVRRLGQGGRTGVLGFDDKEMRGEGDEVEAFTADARSAMDAGEEALYARWLGERLPELVADSVRVMNGRANLETAVGRSA